MCGPAGMRFSVVWRSGLFQPEGVWHWPPLAELAGLTTTQSRHICMYTSACHARRPAMINKLQDRVARWQVSLVAGALFAACSISVAAAQPREHGGGYQPTFASHSGTAGGPAFHGAASPTYGGRAGPAFHAGAMATYGGRAGPATMHDWHAGSAAAQGERPGPAFARDWHGDTAHASSAAVEGFHGAPVAPTGGWGWHGGGWGWRAGWGWHAGWSWNGVVFAGDAVVLLATPPVIFAPLPIFLCPPPVILGIPTEIVPPAVPAPVIAAAPPPPAIVLPEVGLAVAVPPPIVVLPPPPIILAAAPLPLFYAPPPLAFATFGVGVRGGWAAHGWVAHRTYGAVVASRPGGVRAVSAWGGPARSRWSSAGAPAYRSTGGGGRVRGGGGWAGGRHGRY